MFYSDYKNILTKGKKVMYKEKREALYNFKANMISMKSMMIIALSASALMIGSYFYVLYNLKTDNFGEIISTFSGFYIVVMSMNGMGFLRTWEKKRQNCFYEIYAIVPIKREYIIEEEFKYWKYIPIFTGVFSSIINILYFLNPVIKGISGYFVILTISNIIGIVTDYFSRFYRNKFLGIMKIVWIITICLIITLNLSEVINNYFMNFLRLDLFEHMAGIPMLVLSIIIVPVIFIFHYKYTSKNSKKISAWY